MAPQIAELPDDPDPGLFSSTSDTRSEAMSDDWDDDEYEGDESGVEFDEHDPEYRPRARRALLWRRIELLKEKRLLQQQLKDWDELN